MRFWIFSGFTFVWCLMWWYVYTCHIKSCCGGPSDVRMGLNIESGISVPIGDKSGQVIADSKFAIYRDSLLALLVGDRKLIVTGIYGPGESMKLGQDRAAEVLDAFAPDLQSSRYEIRSRKGAAGSELPKAEVWLEPEDLVTPFAREEPDYRSDKRSNRMKSAS